MSPHLKFFQHVRVRISDVWKFWTGSSVVATRFLMLWVLLSSITSINSYAHDPFEVTSEADVSEEALTLETTMLLQNALLLADSKIPDTQAKTKNLFELQQLLEPVFARLFVVTQNEHILLPTRQEIGVDEEGDIVFKSRFNPPEPGKLNFKAIHLSILGEGYTSAIKITRNSKVMPHGLKILHTESLDAAVTVELSSANSSSDSINESNLLSTAKQFYVLGIQHILKGLDHLMFLLGVLLVSKSLKQVLILVTSFTLSHSITLFLSVFNAFTLHPGIVEPLIALSIIFIALDNLFFKIKIHYRYWLVFIFGLAHGLGFSTALQEMNIGSESGLLVIIAAFNLGVESVQVVLALALLPVLLWFRKTRWFRHISSVLSSAIFLAGATWLYLALA